MQQNYDVYIWASYATASVFLLWLLVTAVYDVKKQETRLKRLQSSVEPDREKA
jgi:heme exporter protein CcmD